MKVIGFFILHLSISLKIDIILALPQVKINDIAGLPG